MLEVSAIEPLVKVFEQAWSTTTTPSIHDYLKIPDHDAEQTYALLVELVSVDLEFRWKRSAVEPTATRIVEDYVREFPTLDPLPIVLIEEEYRARHLWGDSPDPASYLKRFPGRSEFVAVALRRIDDELRRERPTNELGNDGRFTFGNTEWVKESQGTSLLLSYGEYLLHEMIGSGQMGRVYRATHVTTSRQVAVKFLRKSFHQDDAAVSRFLREARTVAELRHDGIVRVEGFGDTPGGGYFIVMEYLAGPDLADLVAGGSVTIDDAVRWTTQAAKAIAFSHAAGIIHCDLKPGNLVLDDNRNVRVTDFGLARGIDENVRTVDRIAGTAPYMAPEQVSAWWGSIGPPTDVYALGAVLYALLAGHAPYKGTTVADILSRVVSGVQPVAVEAARPQIHAGLAAVVTKCLNKHPRDRFLTASELAYALEQIDA